MSSFIFLIAAELINLFTVHYTDTEGIQTAEHNLITAPLADDTSLLKDMKFKCQSQILQLTKVNVKS